MKLCEKCGTIARRTDDERKERKRVKDQRLRRTPGTYLFRAVHGIGTPGDVKRKRERRWNRGLPFSALIFDIQERAKNNVTAQGCDGAGPCSDDTARRADRDTDI